MAVSSAASLRLPVLSLAARARPTLEERSGGSPSARLFQRDLFEQSRRPDRPQAQAQALRPQEALRSQEISRPQATPLRESWTLLFSAWDSIKEQLEMLLLLAKLRKK